MKKLKLNVAELGATEILTREELKKVLGGTGSGSGSGSGEDKCAGYSTTCGNNHQQYSCNYRESTKDCYNDFCKAVCTK